MHTLTFQGFLIRFVFALLLVMLTYNPSGYSYAHWVQNNMSSISPLLVLAGISLIIGWVIYIRATLRSLGLMGLILAVVFFAVIVWLLVDWGWLGMSNVSAISWVVLLLISYVLTVGISWSHIRRKLSGQVDSDDVDE